MGTLLTNRCFGEISIPFSLCFRVPVLWHNNTTHLLCIERFNANRLFSRSFYFVYGQLTLKHFLQLLGVSFESIIHLGYGARHCLKFLEILLFAFANAPTFVNLTWMKLFLLYIFSSNRMQIYTYANFSLTDRFPYMCE